VKLQDIKTLFLIGREIGDEGQFIGVSPTEEEWPMRFPAVVIDGELEYLRKHAQEIANASGREVRIISFTQAEVCDTVQPLSTRK